MEQIVRGSVENNPYVAVVQHRYDLRRKLETRVISKPRVVTPPKIGKGKSMMVGQAYLIFVTAVLESGTS
jgi:hypothetical protein